MMNKLIKFAGLGVVLAATAANADIDPFHAHCDLTVTFDESCSDVIASLTDRIGSLDDPNKGTYDLVSKGDDHLDFTHTTPVKKYVDDVWMKFTESQGGCKAAAESKSESFSFYDYDVNFCNIWNIVSEKANGWKSRNCWFKPSPGAEDETCTKA